jgi:hypothetical protein
MRSYTLVGLLALTTAGCSAYGQDTIGAPGSEEGDTEVSEGDIGSTQQKAQFADGTVLNIVDPGLLPSLTVTADFNPVTVSVFYVSDKTTNAGHQPGTVQLVQTIELDADETAQHMINMFHPAMAGGYGSIFVDAAGSSPFDVFQTYVKYGGSMFSVGGSVFTGGSYRIPYTSGTFRMVLAITNQADYTFDVQLSNLGTANFKTISLAPLSTYKFDTQRENWTLAGTNSVQIFTTAGGVIALSGYQDRLLERTRITPVKAAPYF